MAQIIRGTTPTIEFKFKQVDAADLITAILTIKQSGTVLIEKEMDVATVIPASTDPPTQSSISWELSQEECLTLAYGRATIMLNWLTADGTRGASNEYSVDIVQNHIPEVIT